MRGVDEQVEEDLGQAPVAGQHHGDVAVVPHQPPTVLDLVEGHVGGGVDHLVQVHGAEPVLLDTREGAEAARDSGDAAGAVERLIEVAQQLLPRRRGELRVIEEPGQVIAEALQVVEHVRQRVVDLMRHAGGEHAHAGQPVGLGDLSLHPPARGEVVGDEVYGLGAGDRVDPGEQPARAAVRKRHLILDDDGLAGVDDLLDAFGVDRPYAGVQIGERAAHQVLRRAVEE